MNKAIYSIAAAGGLLATLGCGQSATNEPKKLEKIVAEERAGETAPAQPALKTSTSADVALAPAESKRAPVKESPVQQAAFAEAADPEAAGPATVPPVYLSNEHAALCRVKVGDTLPEIELPKVLGGTAKLSTLYGKAATVIVFWNGDRQMALDELSDLGPDVVQKFGSRGVEVVGVAVDQPAGDARSVVQKTAANFPHLLDADGKAFNKVGSVMLPWTILLDANGKVVYFDLEYSLSTRRELQQALLATVR
jgi:peroxiredoxin